MRHLAALEPPELRAAAAAAHCGRLDAADAAYHRAGRPDLALEMRARHGDWLAVRKTPRACLPATCALHVWRLPGGAAIRASPACRLRAAGPAPAAAGARAASRGRPTLTAWPSRHGRPVWRTLSAVIGGGQVERAVVAAGGDARALAAARNHLGNHFADRRQWAQVRARARALWERPTAAPDKQGRRAGGLRGRHWRLRAGVQAGCCPPGQRLRVLCTQRCSRCAAPLSRAGGLALMQGIHASVHTRRACNVWHSPAASPARARAQAAALYRATGAHERLAAALFAGGDWDGLGRLCGALPPGAPLLQRLGAWLQSAGLAAEAAAAFVQARLALSARCHR